MANENKNSGKVWGLILILIGVLFLFQNFDMLDIGDIISTFWPLVLVAIGLKILYDRKSANENDSVVEAKVVMDDVEADISSDKISKSNVFGDMNININSNHFSGGSVSNVFGDIRIDLSKAQVIDNNCKLYVNGIFGSVYIKLPEGVQAKIKANSIAGEMSLKDETHDGLFGNLTSEDPGYDSTAKRIFISSSIIFGSITVN
jgi:predicted membrane protein